LVEIKITHYHEIEDLRRRIESLTSSNSTQDVQLARANERDDWFKKIGWILLVAAAGAAGITGAIAPSEIFHSNDTQKELPMTGATEKQE